MNKYPPTLETIPVQKFIIGDSGDAESEWILDVATSKISQLSQNLSCGHLAMAIWRMRSDAEMPHVIDFEFDLEWGTGKAPVDWKPNGRKMFVRRPLKTDTYPPNVHPGQEIRLYNYNVQFSQASGSQFKPG